MNEINHQGTIYEVAANTIPFLMDLLHGDLSGNHADIMVDLLLWFGELGKDTLYKETHPAQDVTGINPFTRKPMVIRAIDDRPAAKKVREVLRTGFDVYRGFLVRSDGPVRCAAAYALAHYPELAHTFGPPIMAAARAETSPLLRAGLILSLGYVQDTSSAARNLLEPTLQTAVAAEERFAAAVALVHINGHQTSDEAIDLLRSAQNSSEYVDGISGLLWDSREDVERAFEIVGLKG